MTPIQTQERGIGMLGLVTPVPAHLLSSGKSQSSGLSGPYFLLFHKLASLTLFPTRANHATWIYE